MRTTICYTYQMRSFLFLPPGFAFSDSRKIRQHVHYIVDHRVAGEKLAGFNGFDGCQGGLFYRETASLRRMPRPWQWPW